MTSLPAAPLLARPPDVPLSAVGGALLEGLAAQDFDRVVSTMGDDASLTALVPSGLKQWAGHEQIGATFRRWFGDVEEFELVDAVVGEVGSRLHLRWRVRVRDSERGPGWFVVEQQVYADAGADGRLARLFLLCSGFCPEPDPRGSR